MENRKIERFDIDAIASMTQLNEFIASIKALEDVCANVTVNLQINIVEHNGGIVGISGNYNRINNVINQNNVEGNNIVGHDFVVNY
ncbi:hypothetical protein AGMMS50262_08650 [Bacteroidia bacterium]|nr:hypothetical protein FACS189440_16850 [Bacteroidia bacterium]GHT74861.1 hypothetical protein AGMMS50262_08650 [Bacteroidia bacterium]